MDELWAIEQLRAFARTYGSYRSHDYAKNLSDELAEAEPVIEELLDRCRPDWRHRIDQFRRTNPMLESNFQPLAVQATQAAVLLERKSELAEKLGPAGPTLVASRMHPSIWNTAAELWDDGHHAHAIRASCIAFEGHLQAAGSTTLSGSDLGALFSLNTPPTTVKPRLRFVELAPGTEEWKSAHEGTASLVRGAMQAVRNLLLHPGSSAEPSADEALEMLATLSYVCRLVDATELRTDGD